MEGGAKHKFLHGMLELSIFRATMSKPSVPFKCISVSGKPAYVKIKLGNKKVAKTSSERDRVWNQTFQILCAHPADTTVRIELRTKCSVLGRFDFQGDRLLNGESLIEGFFPLKMESGKENKKLKLQFILWFKPAEYEASWGKALENGGFMGLRNATFPQRSNCSVTLYQDAHHKHEFQPPFAKPKNLWEDIYKAIDGAKHLVYIAGWSFNPNIVLVRDPQTEIQQARGVKLGELLKLKAEEGVAVRVMLWDDETSLPIIRNKGVMGTRDEDSSAYFKNTKVVCKLVPRSHHKLPSCFAHHQKTITVDTRKNPGSSAREIMSFLGGLDLFDGRYDTQQHSLFHTLNAESHCYDFYQTSLPGASIHKGGPREPWHDTHSCVTGQAALDVLSNFEHRWIKQCDPSFLVPITSIPELNNNQTDLDSSERDWKVQVFRSIDHVSTTPLPRNMPVESSIQEAYVEAIRRADRFLYIENQYFIGGCHLWEQDQHSGCRNLIPVEIALKIASKIRANERFAAYIVMPMWPEGAPESDSVQDILHWTRETMKMMYRIIGEAIAESGSHGHPRDYLNFFCLANREEVIKGEFVPPYSPHPSSHYWKAQKHRRFMVYVHSKLMIVDDTYLLIGSANVNQRSMDGQRDTEIAIGCYQSRSEEAMIDHGDIHAYRMSLWYEHTGKADKEFLEPQNLECVQKVCSIGEQMWRIYSSDDVTDMKSVHLVSYPVSITGEGHVEDLMEINGHFPDTETPVKGKRSKVLAPMITT